MPSIIIFLTTNSVFCHFFWIWNCHYFVNQNQPTIIIHHQNIHHKFIFRICIVIFTNTIAFGSSIFYFHRFLTTKVIYVTQCFRWRLDTNMLFSIIFLLLSTLMLWNSYSRADFWLAFSDFLFPPAILKITNADNRAHDVRGTSVLRRPERSGDLEPTGSRTLCVLKRKRRSLWPSLSFSCTEWG